ncbi:MAG: hypothetical protein L0Z62_05205 [Gemmataceae bacterium]|nr:hypothetical protein [Gemmataceae bacterium]
MMREDILSSLFFRNAFFGSAFDWLTVLTLFLVALFLVLPQLTGQSLSGRARACFIGTTWILVVKLFLHLIQTLLLNLDMFNNVVSMRGGGPGPGSMGLSAVVLLFFPIVEGMLFVLAAVLFVAGLPGMVERKDERWQPDSARREEEGR